MFTELRQEVFETVWKRTTGLYGSSERAEVLSFTFMFAFFFNSACTRALIQCTSGSQLLQYVLMLHKGCGVSGITANRCT